MTPYSTLLASLGSNVVELKFSRRRPKSNISSSRRMLATLDYNLLNSEQGLSILNFRSPSGSPAYNAKNKGLVVAWDILVQDWRMINTESCDIITKIPTSPDVEFWDYFNKVILPMSAAQKAAFINA